MTFKTAIVGMNDTYNYMYNTVRFLVWMLNCINLHVCIMIVTVFSYLLHNAVCCSLIATKPLFANNAINKRVTFFLNSLVTRPLAISVYISAANRVYLLFPINLHGHWLIKQINILLGIIIKFLFLI